MAPKFKVSREEILDAAYGILKEKGGDAVTTRAVAERLGVSCRPIYTFFPSMETLRSDLVVACIKVLQDYTHRKYTDDSYLNMGVGYIWFYRELPLVADFLERNSNSSMLDKVEERMYAEYLEWVKSRPLGEGLTETDLEDVYSKLSIFTSGLVMYARMELVELSLDETIEYLRSVGEAFFVHLFWKKGNSAQRDRGAWDAGSKGEK